jgi:predicted alpha/beta hydrolase
MLASIFQDGSSFYTEEGTGLACYLARQGYDVYVADLRGKGKSRPPVNATTKSGSYLAITEEIPALLEKISDKRGDEPQIWIGHGWGSVLLCAAYARFGQQFCTVKNMVHFAARRKMRLSNTTKKFVFNIVWKKIARLSTLFTQYIPGRFLRFGRCNETAAMFKDYLRWSEHDTWADEEDGFNYAAAIQEQLPSTIYFAAKGDRINGDPEDVRSFIKTLGAHDGRLMVLSRKDGSLHDYDHVSLLLHPDCEKDHFPVLLRWLQNK